MSEPGRGQYRRRGYDPRIHDTGASMEINVAFENGQYWKAAPNAAAPNIMVGAIPNETGGCKMVGGYKRLFTESIGGNQLSFNQVAGRRYNTAEGYQNYFHAYDLGNEHIAIFYPDSYKMGVWKRQGQEGFFAYVNAYRYNDENTTVGTINEWAPDPLRWAKKSQCTEVGGWIVHGRPSKDMIYGVTGRIKPAFTVGLNHEKGESSDYYDPGRILPMVEAGYFTDDDTPKMSFLGVPVPLASGQHKEMSWGAPFGHGDYWISDATDTAGHGKIKDIEFNSFSNNSNNYCVSDQIFMPGQRFIVAMENNLDVTGPNVHLLTGSAQSTSSAGAVYNLWWHIKSQEGGVDQEYSTGWHYESSSELHGLDDKYTSESDGNGPAQTDTGGIPKAINWTISHPYSVDFDDSGNMYASYWVIQNLGSSKTRLNIRKFIKKTDGTYDPADAEMARIAVASDHDDVAVASAGAVKCIYDNDADALWTVVNIENSSDSELHFLKTSGTWDKDTQPTASVIRKIKLDGNYDIKGYSIDIAKMGSRKYIFALVTGRNSNDEIEPRICYFPLDATASSTIQTMTKLTKEHSFEHKIAMGDQLMFRMFEDNGVTKMGAMGFVKHDSMVKAFAWIAEFRHSDGEKTILDWDVNGYAPVKAEGHLYENKGDEEKHKFGTNTAYETAWIPHDGETQANRFFGYQGDTQGRLHVKSPSLNRWVVRRDISKNDKENYLGRMTFNYRSGGWDIYDPTESTDIDNQTLGKKYSEQIGCRPGAVSGEANLAIPTRMSQFVGGSYNGDSVAGSVVSPSVFYPTTWNGNCILAYTAFHQDGDTVSIHGDSSNALRLSLVYHGTIYGSSNDGGHPYLRGTTEGEGTAKPGLGERPYPSNNMWTGSNMNPLTPVTTFTEDVPKTGTGKKPMLLGMDVNLIERITTESGDIQPGRYRYKFAFAKSGGGEKYRNTGAEGNVLVHNTMDAYVEVDLTEAKGTKGVRLQLNKPMLEGRTVFQTPVSNGNQGDGGGADTHYFIATAGMERSGIKGIGSRLVGESVADKNNGFYSHLDQWCPDNILTNPYLRKTSITTDTTTRLAVSGTTNTTMDIAYVFSGRGSSNAGFQHSTTPANNVDYRLHLVDYKSGADVDMSASPWDVVGVGDEVVARTSPLGVTGGGGVINWGPSTDRDRPYLRYVIVYRTGNLEHAGTDREAYMKVGEIDLVDDGDWTNPSTPISFLDTTPDRYLSSKEAPIDHGMVPIDGNNITAMAASGNNLWIAFNDTNSDNVNKSSIPSTLIRSHEHWEYFNPADVVVVDDNLVIKALKDFDGALWIFSNKGSYVVPDPHEKFIRVWKKDNFVIHSHEEDSNRFVRVGGQIYILGEDGLYLHDPNPQTNTNFMKISLPVDDFFKHGSTVPMGVIYDESTESIICWIKQPLLKPRYFAYAEEANGRKIYTCNYHVPTRGWWSHGEMINNTDDGWNNYFDDIVVISRNGTDDIAELDEEITGTGTLSTLKYKNRKGYFTTIKQSTGSPAYSSGIESSYGYQYIKVDDEIMKVTSTDDDTFYAVARGQYGTDAAVHDNGAVVKNYRKWDTEGIGPLMFGIDRGDTAGVPRAGIIRLGHNYKKRQQQMIIQTNWMGSPGTERYWDKMEIEFEPPFTDHPDSGTSANNPQDDTTIYFEWDIDILNPRAKDNDDDRNAVGQGNENPVGRSAEYGDGIAKYREITNAHKGENIGNNIFLKDVIPIKVKAEMIRLRLCCYLADASGNVTGGAQDMDKDCSDIVIRNIAFRTKYVGRDRMAQ